ncbi:O-antigen/teichoic acid export membrane protein [Methylohalomonas lacus]|uniref:O-antigen/teichoic acid export membrane protein n=1 Tax=Methylohalomonas lacus TaxID=398773 RepID=A0AAE3L251_9GAMM|nr:flippase [Methylohalomonas lacus]MCS3904510.1 O-antigen/teichoic acid export membrane protein [Methylohalomonas lacus]
MASPDPTEPATTGRFERLLGGSESLRGQLIRGGIGSMAVKIAGLLLNLAVAVVLARLLGPAGYGTYAFALSIIMLLAIPAMFGVPNLLVREVAKYQLHEQWPLLRGALRRSHQAVSLMALIIGALALLIILGRGESLAEPGRLTFAIGLLLLPLLALNSLRGAALRGLRRVVQGQLAEMVLTPGLLVLFALAFAVGLSLTPPLAMLAHAAAALTAFIAGSWLLRRALPLQVQTVAPAYSSSEWLAGVLPFSLITGIQVINNQADIVMLGILTDNAAVGLYKVAVQGSVLVAFGLTALNMVLAPHITRLYQQGERERLQRMVKASARVVLLIALPVAAVFALFGATLLELVFGSDYRGAHTALAILAAGQLCNAAAGSVALLLNMSGHERLTAWGVGCAAVVNILLNLILIPRFGINGAAMATAVTLACWNGLLIIAVRRKLDINSTAF